MPVQKQPDGGRCLLAAAAADDDDLLAGGRRLHAQRAISPWHASAALQICAWKLTSNFASPFPAGDIRFRVPTLPHVTAEKAGDRPQKGLGNLVQRNGQEKELFIPEYRSTPHTR